MAYLGRALGFFTTKEGKPGAVYAITGRSEFSRAREFNVLYEHIRSERDALIIYENYFPQREHHRKILAVDPLNGKMTEEQEAQAQFIFYTAIIAEHTNRITGEPALFISNGTQTEAIAQAHDFVPEEVRNRGNYLAGTLAAYEHETDHPNDTARIGGFFTKRSDKNAEGKNIFVENQFGLSIITKTPQLMSLVYAGGSRSVIATYDREDVVDGKKILVPPSSDTNDLSDVIRDFQPSGETADSINKEFFEWLDRDYTVSAATFLLVGGDWMHSVRNFEKGKRELRR